MTPLIRDAPDSLRCEVDLHRARIRMRPPMRLGFVVVTAAVVALDLLLFMVLLGSDVAPAAILISLLLVLNALWLWGARTRRSLNVTVDPDILDVHLTRLGGHYRIPLHDITSARLLDPNSRWRRIRIELPDDTIEIGAGFNPRELSWLAAVIRAAAADARKRPAKRQGMPDEVPAQLAQIQSSHTD